MFKPPIAILLTAMLALTACDVAPDTRKVAKPTGSKFNRFHQKLLELSKVDRDLAIRRAIQDDGGQCPRISGTAYQEDYKGMAMWTARCSNRDFAVYISGGGGVQARPCDDARALGLPACRIKSE